MSLHPQPSLPPAPAARLLLLARPGRPGRWAVDSRQHQPGPRRRRAWGQLPASARPRSADRSARARALVPVRMCCGAQRLGQQFDPVQLAHGGEDVRAVGAASPSRLEQAALARRVQQTLGGVPTQQPAAELAQHAVVEARVGQVEGEQVLPVNARPDRLGRLPVAQPLAELQQRDKGQPSRRIGRLAALGAGVGKACVVEHGAELVTRQQARIAAPERHPCDTGRVVGHRGDGWPRVERYGPASGGKPLSNAAARTKLPNLPTVSEPERTRQSNGLSELSLLTADEQSPPEGRTKSWPLRLHG